MEGRDGDGRAGTLLKAHLANIRSMPGLPKLDPLFGSYVVRGYRNSVSVRGGASGEAFVGLGVA